MDEIIYGIDINNSRTTFEPNKQLCKATGQMCELATDFGYCQITVCSKRNCFAEMKGENEVNEKDNN